MKIHIITGATGFVGGYLVDTLLKRGENVWIIVRPLDNVSAHIRAKEKFHTYIEKWPHTFKVIEGNIMVEGLGIKQSIIEELKNNTVVFWHLAANLSFSTANKADVQKTNYTGTVNVVTFANAVAKKYIHMSTAYVCGDSSSFREDDLDKGQCLRNHYEQSKLEAEKYVHNNCQLPFIVFRPSVIIGDAYQGKAEGCTFGYYRYYFIIYFLKSKIIEALNKGGVVSFLLRIFGTRYNSKNNVLKTPWLIFPRPQNGHVDMVTVDYVIESVVTLYEKNFNGNTVHLTHNNPPEFAFLFSSILHDLDFKNAKLIPVPVWMFHFIINSFYFIAVPVRKYIKSVMWYTPYFTKRCKFDRSTIEQYGKNPPEISRELLRNINIYAKKNILEHIDMS